MNFYSSLHKYLSALKLPRSRQELIDLINSLVVVGTGGGTVKNTSGSLTSNSVVLGAGLVESKVSSGITSDGIAKIILGVGSATAGSVDLKNATASGTTTVVAAPGVSSTATLTLPGSTDTIVGRATTDILTNKTLTFPVLNSPTGLVKADVGLGNADNTSDVNKPVSNATKTSLNTKGTGVGSITSLRALLKTESPQALVSGYYANGDGGGGSYFYDPTDTTSTDNGGTVIVATDGGRWKPAWNQVINASQFGVKADGVTDATAPLANAIAAAIAAGGFRKIVLPPGPVLLNGGTTPPDGFKNGALFPFSQVNFDPTQEIQLCGQGTILKCGANNMVLLRISRNNVTIKDLTLDYNGKTGVYLCGIIPEDMTQTTTLVSQSFIELDRVNRIGGSGADGLVIQPGPNVGGSDSGIFYHKITGGVSSFIGGGRHMWSKKNVDWSTNPNRATRTVFFGQRFIRGNTGYQFDVGSEIELHGCFEEIINSGTSPQATPVARYVGDDVSGNIRYFGGYSETCTRSTRTPTGGKVLSYGYSFNSGPDVNEWAANSISYDDETLAHLLTPTLTSSGGGSQGSGSSNGYSVRQGKFVTVVININVAKGTLANGSLGISGIQFAGRSAAGTQWLSVPAYANMTLAPSANAVLGAFVSGFNISLRKSRNDGASDTSLTVQECGSTISFSVQGTYIAE